MANLGNFRAYKNADCKGDKIKLPESVSQRLLSIPNITYPLCFELSVPISREDILNAMQNGLAKPQRRLIHCGILDFTAGEGCVCIPKWIMDNLNVTDSFVLNVANITLPKGRFVRLQPHSVLKDIKTKQKLESSLRNFTTLTANTTITMESMNNIKINVLEVKPNKNNLNSIQIIDTDLVVEFEAALDGTTTTHQHFERNLQINNSEQMEDIINDKVKKGEFRFYKLQLSGGGIDNIKIRVTPTDNKYDLDLYASWKNYEPGTDTDNYDYHCVEHGAAQIIINVNEYNSNSNKDIMDIDSANEKHKSKYLYLSVHGFDEQSANDKKQDNDNENKEDELYINYTLHIANISMSDMEIKELYRASSLEIHDQKINEKNNNNNNNNKNDANNETELPLSSDPNKQFCVNCHRFVNKWSYDRHHQHCIKQFSFCNSCKKVIKISEMENHNKTLHNDLKCKMCQETISGGKQTLISHQKYECLKRPMTCDYCHLPFAFINLDEHTNMCGARTELCVHCNQYIALAIIQSHTMDVHGMEYETPSGIARMQSDDSMIDYTAYMNLGGFGAPERNYNEMNNDNNNKERTSVNERWICSSCDYNNRPNHIQCKICKAKRTKYMKKVSEIDDPKKKKQMTPVKQKKDNIEKIGGNMGNIPQRNYDDMLNKDRQNNNDYTPNIKSEFIKYNDKQGDQNTNKSDIIVSSGVDPSQIPQRDYDKMLNAEEIDDTAAFINENNTNKTNANEMDDIAMVEMDDHDNENENNMFSSNIENIPNRNYDHMLKQQQENQYDEAMEQRQLIETLTKQFEHENKNKRKSAQYRADTAIVPQRNYDKMLKSADNTNNNNDVHMSNNNNNKNNNQTEKEATIPMATSSSGYWVCPSDECDHLNKATRNNCSVCHTLKPTYRRTAQLLDDSIDQLGLEHRWVCKNCDGLNKGSRNKCVYCKEVKTYQPNSKSAAQKVIRSTKKPKIESGIFQDVERWVCPNKECNFLNKGSRLKCQVCHTQRKDAHIVWGDKAKKNNNENNINENNMNENDNDNENENVDKDKNTNNKMTYSHPLEARMMGMDVDKIHNVVKVDNSKDNDNSNTNENINDSTDIMEWPCPICTFLNKESKCQMCGCPKDAQ